MSEFYSLFRLLPVHFHVFIRLYIIILRVVNIKDLLLSLASQATEQILSFLVQRILIEIQDKYIITKQTK